MRQNPFGNDRTFGGFDFDDLWTRMGMNGWERDDSNASLERGDDGYVVLADIPGFGKEDIDIRFEDGYLTVTGSHGTDEEAEGRRMARSRHVHERVRVPGDVRVDDITASLKNGVLEVHLPVEGETGDEGHRIDIE